MSLLVRLSRCLALVLVFIGSGTKPSLAANPAPEPVVWSAVLTHRATATAHVGARGAAAAGTVVSVHASIAPSWHIYSPTTPAGGPIPTTIELVPAKGPWLRSSGALTQSLPKRSKDAGFGIFVETYEKAADFWLPVTLNSPGGAAGQAKVKIRYQACNDKFCLPPRTLEIPVTTGAILAARAAGPTSPTLAPLGLVVPRSPKSAPTGLLAYLLLAAVSGFAALLTPCVFPMIPITVSVFTKHRPHAGVGFAGPLAYCAGIVFTFTGIGVVASALFGAAGVPLLAANPWLNLGMAALFTVLACNLFGWFEIVVPARLVNAVQPNQRSPLLGPALMGVVFSLTSFTCTVPFVGTTLFSAATGGLLRPALGMAVFSCAFALPFFLLALFPSWLSKMPRSGEWLVGVKGFLGFLELAAALKFVQQADYTWQLHLLTRPRFLAIWALLAALSVLYLWRVAPRRKQEPGASPSTSLPRLGPVRCGFGLAMCCITVALLGAMRGVSLGDLDAYLPPPAYGTAAGNGGWIRDDFATAQSQARREHLPLLVNFTGYACTNCRLMEQHVLNQPEVTRQYPNFVTVELHTDGPDAASRRNSQLQQRTLGTVAIPVYAVLSPEGKLEAQFEGLDRNPENFAQFLRTAHRGLAG